MITAGRHLVARQNRLSMHFAFGLLRETLPRPPVPGGNDRPRAFYPLLGHPAVLGGAATAEGASGRRGAGAVRASAGRPADHRNATNVRQSRRPAGEQGGPADRGDGRGLDAPSAGTRLAPAFIRTSPAPGAAQRMRGRR